MTAFVESGGAVVAYEYADVTIVSTGPYGRRETPCRITFDRDDDPFLALLLARCAEAVQRHVAESGGGLNMGGIG